MSGYRQHSYDPNAGWEDPRPLKPYDLWQWTGVAALAAAVLALLAAIFFETLRDWMHLAWMRGGAGFMIAGGGLLLVRYRREPTEDEPNPERRERRRRLGGMAFIAIGMSAVAYNFLASLGAA